MRNQDVSDGSALEKVVIVDTYLARTGIVTGQADTLHIARSKTLFTTARASPHKDIITQSEASDISQLLIISGHFASHQAEDDKSSQFHPER
jgi:hypothetical protein